MVSPSAPTAKAARMTWNWRRSPAILPPFSNPSPPTGLVVFVPVVMSGTSLRPAGTLIFSELAPTHDDLRPAARRTGAARHRPEDAGGESPCFAADDPADGGERRRRARHRRDADQGDRGTQPRRCRPRRRQ